MAHLCPRQLGRIVDCEEFMTNTVWRLEWLISAIFGIDRARLESLSSSVCVGGVVLWSRSALKK